jgi:hypothetical protein
MANWSYQVKTRGTPAEIEELAGWLRSIPDSTVTVSGPNEAGIHHVKIAADPVESDEVKLILSHWAGRHPGLIFPSDDWLPT